MKKRKQGILLFVVVIIAIVTMLFFLSEKARGARTHIAMGEKYLEDLNYEQALAEYKQALDIDPQNESVIAAIENLGLQFTDSVMADTEEVSVDRLRELISFLEESYYLTKREVVHLQILEIEEIIQDKEDKDREEELARQIKEREYQEKEAAGEEVINAILGFIKDTRETILSENVIPEEYKGPLVLFDWNVLESITVIEIEGSDYWEAEVQTWVSAKEYYTYRINKNTLEGQLIKFRWEDDLGNVANEENYDNEPIIDFKKFINKMNKDEKMLNSVLFQVIVNRT